MSLPPNIRTGFHASEWFSRDDGEFVVQINKSLPMKARLSQRVDYCILEDKEFFQIQRQDPLNTSIEVAKIKKLDFGNRTLAVLGKAYIKLHLRDLAIKLQVLVVHVLEEKELRTKLILGRDFIGIMHVDYDNYRHGEKGTPGIIGFNVPEEMALLCKCKSLWCHCRKPSITVCMECSSLDLDVDQTFQQNYYDV
jgi:hypothetical protein